MRIRIAILSVLLLALLVAQKNDLRTIKLDALRDKIAGGWAGQMVGVSYGAPTEFRFREKIIDVPIEWKPEQISNTLNQDDLYVDMTFAQVLDAKGLDATTEDFGNLFKTAKYRLWHANLAARRALNRGVPASKSGTPEFNAHANDIDFQIEADFIGLMAPGLPRAANDLAWRAGRVMNFGDGIYGGMFVSCMYSAAFFENSPRKIVEEGLRCLPSKSPYAQTIADTLAWSNSEKDWKRVWALIEKKWNQREPCPEGALKPFNIDAKLNGAYIALGLLYGNGDFFQTLDISTRAGQDSDCNPSNACGILGVMLGYKGIPAKFTQGIPAIADQKFRYTEHTFTTITDSTLKRAIALVERNGGRREGETLLVKVQKPVPAKLQIWNDYGSPVERIAVSDARWKFSGAWKPGAREGMIATAKGAEATVTFEGTGAILAGPYLPDGGKADVYLDGALHQTVDVYPDEDQPKRGEAVWHKFKLKPGKHTVRLVVRGERYGGSSGTAIGIEDLVVFR